MIIWLERTARIRVGRLGVRTFPRGFYLYTGRAKRGLEKRLARHLRRRKRKRWHIDYLLTCRSARLIGVLVLLGAWERECEWNQRVIAQADGIIPSFGASDCRSGCRSHLAYIAPRDVSLRRGEGWTGEILM